MDRLGPKDHYVDPTKVPSVSARRRLISNNQNTPQSRVRAENSRSRTQAHKEKDLKYDDWDKSEAILARKMQQNEEAMEALRL